jgi:hypothetical protein
MRKTAVGRPIVGASGGFDHRSVEPDEKHDGYVVESYDGGDGWECIKFLVSERKTKDVCAGGAHQLSCAYIPTKTDGKPGLWHNVPYDETILDGEYTHFAVVPNPRYEGAEIELVNSRKTDGGIVNKVLKAALALFPIKDLKEVLNSLEADKALEEKKNAAVTAAKTAFDNAMAAAKTEEEKAAAKNAYDAALADAEKMCAAPEPEPKPGEAKPGEKPNAEQPVKTEPPAAEPPAAKTADAPPAKEAPKPPVGGGDVVAEPGAPAPEPPAKPAANAEPAAKPGEPKPGERKNGVFLFVDQQGEEVTIDAATADEAWQKLSAETATPVDQLKAAVKLVMSGNAAPKDEKVNSVSKRLVKERVNAAERARREAVRQERFNALRTAAEERGGDAGVASVGLVTLDEKEDLGRERYGS